MPVDTQKHFARALTDGAQQLGIEFSEQQLDQLLDYLAAFDKWNRAYNLSAVRDPEAMVSRHLLDSLSVLPFVRDLAPDSLIDVGTGGGLPGIPLAIMMPDCRITLLDSNGKKTRFLVHLQTLLGLENIRVQNCRAEAYRPETGYPAVISRAFASLADMTRYCGHLLAPGGVYLAMKGVYPSDEINDVAGSHRLVSNYKLNVPDSEGERHLLVLKPIGSA